MRRGFSRTKNSQNKIKTLVHKHLFYHKLTSLEQRGFFITKPNDICAKGMWYLVFTLRLTSAKPNDICAQGMWYLTLV